MKIVCKSHGPFMQSPYEHVSGKGCPMCARKKATLTEINNMDGHESLRPYSFYLIRVRDSDFEFFKVGVTHHKNVKMRFPSSRYSDFDIDVIHTERGNKRDILLKEYNALSYLDSVGVRYKMNSDVRDRFVGWTECFEDKRLVNDILSKVYLV